MTLERRERRESGNDEEAAATSEAKCARPCQLVARLSLLTSSTSLVKALAALTVGRESGAFCWLKRKALPRRYMLVFMSFHLLSRI